MYIHTCIYLYIRIFASGELQAAASLGKGLLSKNIGIINTCDYQPIINDYLSYLNTSMNHHLELINRIKFVH
jgi:hypothetical protein